MSDLPAPLELRVEWREGTPSPVGAMPRVEARVSRSGESAHWSVSVIAAPYSWGEREAVIRSAVEAFRAALEELVP